MHPTLARVKPGGEGPARLTSQPLVPYQESDARCMMHDTWVQSRSMDHRSRQVDVRGASRQTVRGSNNKECTAFCLRDRRSDTFATSDRYPFAETPGTEKSRDA